MYKFQNNIQHQQKRASIIALPPASQHTLYKLCKYRLRKSQHACPHHTQLHTHT